MSETPELPGRARPPTRSRRGCGAPSPRSGRGARPRSAWRRAARRRSRAPPGTSAVGRSAFGAAPAQVGHARRGSPRLAASRRTRSAASSTLRIDEFESPRRRGGDAAGSRVDVVVHQRRAELAGTLDRQALRAQRGDQVLGVREPQFVGGHVAEARPIATLRRQSRSRLVLVAPVRVAGPDELAMQPLGRDTWNERAGRGGRPDRPLVGGGVHSPRLTFSIRKRRSACAAIVVPALPGAAEAHVVGLAAVGELDAVARCRGGRRAAQRSAFAAGPSAPGRERRSRLASDLSSGAGSGGVGAPAGPW